MTSQFNPNPYSNLSKLDPYFDKPHFHPIATRELSLEQFNYLINILEKMPGFAIQLEKEPMNEYWYLGKYLTKGSWYEVGVKLDWAEGGGKYVDGLRNYVESNIHSNVVDGSDVYRVSFKWL